MAPTPPPRALRTLPAGLASAVPEIERLLDALTVVNPRGRLFNCHSCAFSVDDILAGRPGWEAPEVSQGSMTDGQVTAIALEHGGRTEGVLPLAFTTGRQFLAALRTQMPKGSRAIVLAGDRDGVHVFNALRAGDAVVIVDGQRREVTLDAQTYLRRRGYELPSPRRAARGRSGPRVVTRYQVIAMGPSTSWLADRGVAL